MKNHTVLSVVTFPEDIFYPVGVRTLGLFIKKGNPHPKTKSVFWAKVNYDGFVKSKGKRLTSSKAADEFREIKPYLIKAVNEEKFTVNKPKYYINKPIDFSDRQLELIPEAYLDEGITSVAETVNEADKIARELVSFLIMSKQLGSTFIKFSKTQKTKPFTLKSIKYKIFGIRDLFNYVNTGHFHVSGDLDTGNIPLISCKTIENGTEGYFDIQSHLFENCVTIASDGSWPMSSFYHTYKFAAKDNAIVCRPNKNLNIKAILFITAQLNSQIWRFSYGRKCYLNKTDKIQIPLPVKAIGDIDFDIIDAIIDSCPVWNDLKAI